MAKAPADKVYEELYEGDPVPLYEKPTSSATLRVRIVKADTEPKMRLDIRQHIVTTKYTGFTARGIAVSLEQAPKLAKSINALIEKMTKIKSTKKGK